MSDSLRQEFVRRMRGRTPAEELVFAALAGLLGVATAILATALLHAVGLGLLLDSALELLGIVLAIVGGVGGFTVTRIWLRGARQPPEATGTPKQEGPIAPQ
jgi:hypothetical protein